MMSMGTRTPTDHEIRILQAASKRVYDANSIVDLRVCAVMAMVGWLVRGEEGGVAGYLITDAGRAALP